MDTRPPRFAFPVSLDVAGRRCVVVGAGPMAAEKAEALRAAGADVVAPPADGFTDDLLNGAFLLVVSGEDGTDTDAVFAAAERRGVLTNILDDIPHCHFAFPSVVERGPLKLAVSTAGKAPALARRVRIELDEYLADELGEVVTAYDDARARLLPRQVGFDVWSRAWRQALDDLDGLLELAAVQGVDAVRDRILAEVSGALATATTGKPAAAASGAPDTAASRQEVAS